MVALLWEQERQTTDLKANFCKNNVKSLLFHAILLDAARARATGCDDTRSPQIRVASRMAMRAAAAVFHEMTEMYWARTVCPLPRLATAARKYSHCNKAPITARKYFSVLNSTTNKCTLVKTKCGNFIANLEQNMRYVQGDQKSLCIWWRTVINRCTETFWSPCISHFSQCIDRRCLVQNTLKSVTMWLRHMFEH